MSDYRLGGNHNIYIPSLPLSFLVRLSRDNNHFSLVRYNWLPQPIVMSSSVETLKMLSLISNVNL